MADFYLKSGSGALALSNRAWSLGDRMVPARSDATSNVNTARAWVWECTTAGSTTGTPTWPSSVTQDSTTVTQNSVVFTARKPGYSSGSTANWAYATIFQDYAALAATSTDRIFRSNNHAESNASAMTVTSPGRLVTVDDSATPPTTQTTGASVATTGSNAILLNGASSYDYGCIYSSGSGAVTILLGLAGANSTQSQIYEQCKFRVVVTVTGGRINVCLSVNSNSGSRMEWRNCSVRFVHSGQGINVNGGVDFRWLGGSYESGGTNVNTLFLQMGQNAHSARLLIEGVDFSNWSSSGNLFVVNGGGAAGASKALLRGCTMPTGWDSSGSLVNATPSLPGVRVCMENCWTAAGVYIPFWIEDYFGTVRAETTIVKSGSTISAKMSGSANCDWPDQGLELADFGNFEIVEEVTAADVGVLKTYTISVLRDSALNLNNSHIHVRAAYPGSNIQSIASTIKPNIVAATDLPSDSATWTTTGLTNPNAQKLVVTFTPQAAGKVRFTVVLMANITVYVCPDGVLS